MRLNGRLMPAEYH